MPPFGTLRIDAIAGEHAEAPHLRIAQRALADEVVALVHGADAAAAAAAAADVLFANDPTGASRAAFEMLAGEIPTTRLPASELDDAVAVLVATELASSNGDARRSMDQNAYSANGVKLTANDQLSAQKLLHGKYLLLRRGKKLHHLLEIIS